MMAAHRQRKAEIHFERSWNHERKGNLEVALQEISRAILLSPRQSPYWVSKAHYLYALGRLDEALEGAKRATELDANNDTAWTFLGRLECRRHRFKKSAEAFRRSLEIRPHYAVYTLLGAVEVEFDPQSALRSAKRALSMEPNWEEAKLVKIEATRRLRNKPPGRTS